MEKVRGLLVTHLNRTSDLPRECLAHCVGRLEPHADPLALAFQSIPQFIQDPLQRIRVVSERSPHAISVNRQFTDQPCGPDISRPGDVCALPTLLPTVANG